MTVQQFRERLKAMRGEVISDLSNVLQIAAQTDLVANIRTRVQNKSTKATMTQFGPYSSQYAAYRKKKGNQNILKNFTLSGDMWRGFGMKAITNTSVTIGGKTDYSQKVMGYNSEREGINIIQPSDAEIKAVKKRFIDWLFLKIKKTGV